MIINKNLKYLILTLCCSFAISCSNKASKLSNTENNKLLSGFNFNYLDSINAAIHISKDDKEMFFDKINKIDMAIQMKRHIDNNMSAKDMIYDYKLYLKKDVRSFTTEEKILLSSILQDIKTKLDKFHFDLIIGDVNLIMTKGNHYGDGVYYTRENCIIIPQDQVNGANRSQLTETMVHELSHIYTRYNAKNREKLYGLIGFQNIEKNRIKINFDPLKEMMLLNPDGVDLDYVINTYVENKNVLILPMIFTTVKDFNDEKPDFFNYLNVNVCELDNTEVGWQFKSDISTKTSNTVQIAFYQNIKENTQYIIHPDEIIADNMMLLFKSKIDNSTLNDFNEEGKRLLLEIEKIMIKN
jgi:hypothetical protein